MGGVVEMKNGGNVSKGKLNDNQKTQYCKGLWCSYEQ